MAAARVALVLGAGPKIGAAVAAKFAGIGYKVAVVSRNGTGAKTPEGYLSLKADFAKPSSVTSVFEAVKTEFSAAPSVVVYNAAVTDWIPEGSLFQTSLDKFESDLNVNSVAVYAAAKEAVSAWDSLPEGTKKTFIFTGNILDQALLVANPSFLDLGVGKAASAHLVSFADAVYAEKGARFFYADERKADGTPIGNDAGGPSHAEFYAQLADHEKSKDWPWRVTFTDGNYVKY